MTSDCTAPQRSLQFGWGVMACDQVAYDRGHGVQEEFEREEVNWGGAGDGDKSERKEEGVKALNSKANYSTYFEKTRTGQPPSKRHLIAQENLQ